AFARKLGTVDDLVGAELAEVAGFLGPASSWSPDLRARAPLIGVASSPSALTRPLDSERPPQRAPARLRGATARPGVLRSPRTRLGRGRWSSPAMAIDMRWPPGDRTVRGAGPRR